MAARYVQLADAVAGGGFAMFEPRLRAAAEDEFAHAALCASVCVALGSAPSDEPAPPHEPVGDVLLAIAVTCAIGETLNVVVLQDEFAVCVEPLRATTRRLLTDEMTHARLGWDVVAYAARLGSLAHLARSIAASIQQARACDTGEAATFAPERRVALLDTAISEIIIPGFARFGVALEDALRRV